SLPLAPVGRLLCRIITVPATGRRAAKPGYAVCHVNSQAAKIVAASPAHLSSSVNRVWRASSAQIPPAANSQARGGELKKAQGCLIRVNQIESASVEMKM